MSEVKLYHGDCLVEMNKIADKSVDMILCDLPYGTTACSWDIVIPFESLWKQYNRVIKDNGTIVLFGSEPFSSKLRCSNLEMYRYDYVWIKNNCGNFQLANKNPLKYHENISVFYKDIIHLEFSNIIQKQMKLKNISFRELSKLILSKNGNETGWLSNKIKGTQIPTKEQWEVLCKYFNIENNYDTIISTLKTHTFNCEFKECEIHRNNKNKGGNLGHFSENNDDYIQTKTNYNKSILYFNRESKPIHPTQKPTNLLVNLLLNAWDNTMTDEEIVYYLEKYPTEEKLIKLAERRNLIEKAE